MTAPEGIPNPEQLVEILKDPTTPDVLTLDLGGSADINRDGYVHVALDKDGNLTVMDNV